MKTWLTIFFLVFSMLIFAQGYEASDATSYDDNYPKYYENSDELNCPDSERLKWNGEVWECWPKEDFENYNRVEV